MQVLHFGPEGEAHVAAFVSIAFDRPMVALGTDPEADALVLEPKVDGRARWLGSQTLVFEPRGPFPGATEFRVRVPKGLKALDGNRLESELAFTFTTPAPAVVQADPSDGARHERLNRTIDVYFNQNVAVEQVQSALALSVRTGNVVRRAAAVVSRPNAKDLRLVRVAAKETFALGSQVTLEILGHFKSDEGPRAMGAAFKMSFETYGPLGFESSALCPSEGCSPSGVTLRFTNPVNVKDALKQLVFSPEVPVREGELDADYTTEYLHVWRNFSPNTEYTVRLTGNLRDAFGNTFSGARSLTFRTGPYGRDASFMGLGGILPTSVSPKVSLRLANLENPILKMWLVPTSEVEAYASSRKRTPGTGVVITDLAKVSGSERRVDQVDLSPMLRDGKGVVLLQVTDKASGKEPLTSAMLAVTDLAPTLKIGTDGGVVWVTRLASTEKVEGAQVRLVDCGKTLSSGVTNSDGLFTFALKKAPECDVYAVVEKDGDVSFAHKYAGLGPWDFGHGGGGGDESNYAAYLFTERGVYRPGETLQLKGILRKRHAEGLKPLSGSVTVHVSDSQGREFEKVEAKLNTFGTFARAIRIPGSISLGPVSIEVKQGDAVFRETVEVAEFRRAELEVSVRSEQTEIVRGNKAKLHIAGNYLFGAPVAHQRVVWSGRRVTREALPKGDFDGFTFDDDTRWFEENMPPESTTFVGGEGKLDARGELAIEVPADMDLSSGVAGLEVEATVDGLSGATAAGRTVLSVTPASFLVGLKASSSLITPGQTFSLDLASTKLDGDAVSNVALDVTLERRVYSTELQEGEGGRNEYVSRHKDESVQTCKVTTQKGRARCELSPREPGLHFVRLRAKDAAGRKVHAALALYAYGSGEASWGDDSKGPILSLKADRERYQLGDVAKVLVASPFEEAEAIVTVEREGVLSVEQRRIVGKAATLEIPVDKRFVPNAFVSVLLVRPVSGARSDAALGLPYRAGSVELRADVEKHHLRVTVTPDATDKRPGDTVDVSFQVKDGLGKATKAELTVFAVDEGVLSLTGFKTPDPFDSLYAPRGLSVWTADARGALAREVNEDDKGGSEGGGGGDGTGTRKNFDALAFYAPEVVTDGAGRAKVSFKLPDSLTRYRIMAVAVSEAADFGAGEAAVRTQKPLMLRSALPRALRVGDALEAGVTLHNESEGDMDVDLRAEITGVVLDGESTRRVFVPKGGAVEARFKLHATHAGEAAFKFTARAGAESDALSLTRSVALPLPLETVSTSGRTSSGAREAIEALKGVRSDAGGVELLLSTTALSELKAPAQALIDYAYNCTEQLASRLVGLSAMKRLKERGVLEMDGLEARAESVLGELERHQRGDGGFGLWTGHDWDLPASLTAFLTSYALIAVEEARAADMQVSTHTIETARDFLVRYLRDVRQHDRKGVDYASMAFSVYALARVGHMDAGYLATLYEQREKLDVASQVALSHALLMAEKQEESRVVYDRVASHLNLTADEAHLETNRGDEYAVLMGSDVRATSQVTLLLLARDARDVLIPRLARWLSSARELDGTWGNTQDNAWGLLALARYLDLVEKETPDLKVTGRIDQKRIADVRLAGRKAAQAFLMPMAELNKKGSVIELESSGTGTLHYTMRLSYARDELPQKPEERGFYVERTYDRIDPLALAQGNVQGERAMWAKAGDYVRVTVQVVVPATRRFVVVEDPLPAGLEPVNLAWVNESQAAQGAIMSGVAPYDHSEMRDTMVAFAASQLEPGVYRYEYLARASTPGVFVTPPAGAHEMYHPETFGQTAATLFEVRTP